MWHWMPRIIERDPAWDPIPWGLDPDVFKTDRVHRATKRSWKKSLDRIDNARQTEERDVLDANDIFDLDNVVEDFVGNVTTACVKMKLNTFCRDVDVRRKLNSIVMDMNRLVAEAYTFGNHHISTGCYAAATAFGGLVRATPATPVAACPGLNRIRFILTQLPPVRATPQPLSQCGLSHVGARP